MSWGIVASVGASLVGSAMSSSAQKRLDERRQMHSGNQAI